MKKILLFILLQLIWICLLVGGLFMYHNSLSPRDSHPTTIKIMSGNPLDNTLKLDPDANIIVPVYKFRKVIWEIAPSSNVKSFRIETKKKSKKIFVIGFPPPTKHTRSGWGTVGNLKADGTNYSYSIFWRMEGDPEDMPDREFDPKLSVRSNSFAFLELLMYIVYAVLGLLSFMIFRTSKK